MPHLEKHCRKCGVWIKHLNLDYLILGALFCVLKRRLGSVTAKKIYFEIIHFLPLYQQQRPAHLAAGKQPFGDTH